MLEPKREVYLKNYVALICGAIIYCRIVEEAGFKPTQTTRLLSMLLLEDI